MFWKYAANSQDNTNAEVRFRYRTSASVFSCKFAAYFQSTFFKEHFWTAASSLSNINTLQGVSCFKFENILKKNLELCHTFLRFVAVGSLNAAQNF